jgi:uncharacterized membrane protein HdeD (DUF308 family)
MVAHRWWIFPLRGLLALVFGICVFAAPGPSVAALVLLFGLFALTDGLVALFYSFTRDSPHRWALFFGGLLGIFVGIMTLRRPGVTAVVLYGYIAFWAIFIGIAQILTALRLRRQIEGEWLLVFSGGASIIFGVLLLAMPAAGVVALVWLIAAYALAAGLSQIALGFRLRSIERERPSEPLLQP